jgi:hypothetical protein
MAEVVPPLRVNNALPCAAVNDDDRFDRDYQVRHRRIGCAVGQYRRSGCRLGQRAVLVFTPAGQAGCKGSARLG